MTLTDVILFLHFLGDDSDKKECHDHVFGALMMYAKNQGQHFEPPHSAAVLFEDYPRDS